MFSIEIGLILLLLLFTVFLATLTHVFLCLWVYRDAKSRCVNATLWTVLTALFSVIGFLFYLIVGRKQNLTKCSHCNNPVNPNLPCCPNCGIRLSSENMIGYPLYVEAQAKKKPVKQIKVALIVTLCLCLTSMAACSFFLIKTANTYSYTSSHYGQ